MRSRLALGALLSLVVCAGSLGASPDDLVDQATAYDDAWEAGPSGWVACMRDVNDGFAGTAGLVVQLGDSITYANPAHQWISYGAGRTAEDNVVRAYMHVDAGDATDGVFLARWDGDDVPPLNQSTQGSFTAETGMETAEYLSSPTYGLPNCDSMFVTGSGTDGAYNNFTGGHAAEICIVMLGTNDAGVGRSAADFRTNMETIVTKIMQNNHTVVVLATIPPKRGNQTIVQGYNQKIRDLAENGLVIPGLNGGSPVKFPLIDYYQEIVTRRPTDWDGTLMSPDGMHPSASYGGTAATSDPYADGGSGLANSGYLLRCFNYVQKIREVKDYVIDRSKDPAVTADAGPDQTVPVGVPVTLDGSGSTGETSRTWTVTAEPAGSSVSLSDPGAEKPTFTPTVAGDYVFRLEVTSGSSSDTDTVVVHVVEAEADAGGPLDGVLVGTVVTLTGTGSPAPAVYAWTVETRPPSSSAAIQNASSLEATFTPDVPGTYAFRLTVTYGTSQATDTVALEAHSVIARAGPDRQIPPDSLVTLDGSASLGGASILSYTWTEVSSTGVTLTPSATDPAKVTFTSGADGTVYVFKLTVESTDGEVSEDTVTLTVRTFTSTRSTGGCWGGAVTSPGCGGLAGLAVLLLLGRRRRWA